MTRKLSEFDVFRQLLRCQSVSVSTEVQPSHPPLRGAGGFGKLASILLFMSKCIILWSYLRRTEEYVKLQLQLCLISNEGMQVILSSI